MANSSRGGLHFDLLMMGGCYSTLLNNEKLEWEGGLDE